MGSVALIRSVARAYGTATPDVSVLSGRMKSPCLAPGRLTPDCAEQLSILHFAMQFGFGAIRIFKGNIHLVAIKGQRPNLRFAVSQNSAFNRKTVLAEPAPFGGIDPVIRRRALAE